MSSESDQTALVTNDDVRNLPLLCPKIFRFGLMLNCANDLTDDSLLYALSKWPQHSITMMNFYGCRLVTDAILPQIQQFCPFLTELYVWHTSITKEALLAFILSMVKNGVFHHVAAPDLQSKYWIAAQLKEHKWMAKRVQFFQP